jgi:U3 small nucleolar ribonucleoprotein protein IMP4
MNMRELLLKALELDEFNLAIVNEIKGNPSKITFYSNKGKVLLVILIGATIDNEKMNIAPSQLKIVSEVEKLDVLSDIMDLDLVDSAEDNYILVSKSDDLVARISFINKFGDKINFQINVKKVLEVTND